MSELAISIVIPICEDVRRIAAAAAAWRCAWTRVTRETTAFYERRRGAKNGRAAPREGAR